MSKFKILFPVILFSLFISCKGEVEFKIISKEIKEDPYGINPLCAIVTLKTSKNCRIETSIRGKGKDGYVVNKSFDKYDKDHTIPIIGLYQGHMNAIAFKFYDEENNLITQEIIKIRTYALQAPQLDIKVNKSTKGPKLFMTSHINSGMNTVWDRNGETRAMFKNTMLPTKLDNGNYLFAKKSGLVEITAMGEETNSIDLPFDYRHINHEVIQINNGNYLVSVGKTGSIVPSYSRDGTVKSLGDYIIELDRNSGEVLNEWDMKNYYDTTRKIFASKDDGDWFHINSIDFDTSDQSIIVSGRHQGIVKIGYEDKKLKWILTPKAGFKAINSEYINSNYLDYLLTAVDKNGKAYNKQIQDGNKKSPDAEFHWPHGQHSAIIKPSSDGLLHLLVFNNQASLIYDNNDDKSHCIEWHKNSNNRKNDYNEEPYSLMVEYVINEKDMNVSELKSFNQNFFSSMKSNVDYSDESKTYMMFGHHKIQPNKLTEFDENGEVIFAANVIGFNSSMYRVKYLDSLE